MHRIRATMVRGSPARRPHQLPEELKNPGLFVPHQEDMPILLKFYSFLFQNWYLYF